MSLFSSLHIWNLPMNRCIASSSAEVLEGKREFGEIPNRSINRERGGQRKPYDERRTGIGISHDGGMLHRAGRSGEVLSIFLAPGRHYILHLEQERGKLPQLCATSRKIPELLSGTLWSRGFPAIFTSGTLKAGMDFHAPGRKMGWKKKSG